jgi:hypothetical protein
MQWAEFAGRQMGYKYEWSLEDSLEGEERVEE